MVYYVKLASTVRMYGRLFGILGYPRFGHVEKSAARQIGMRIQQDLLEIGDGHLIGVRPGGGLQHAGYVIHSRSINGQSAQDSSITRLINEAESKDQYTVLIPAAN